VSEKVASKFSDMRLLSLGNLLFLRFLNPGVLTPNPGIPGIPFLLTNPLPQTAAFALLFRLSLTSGLTFVCLFVCRNGTAHAP
jgi:hypothetical protein